MESRTETNLICHACWLEKGVREAPCKHVRALCGECNRHHWEGYEAGLRAYAWWKDGAQQVGSCGTSLMVALKRMDNESGIPCPGTRFEPDDGVEYCGRCGVAKCAHADVQLDETPSPRRLANNG